MNWMTKHYVQRPTPFDALEGLIDSGRPKNIILPPSRIFEDNIQGFKKYNQIETGSSQIRKVHLSYSCNNITTTLIQISRLFYFGFFSKTNHYMII